MYSKPLRSSASPSSWRVETQPPPQHQHPYRNSASPYSLRSNSRNQHVPSPTGSPYGMVNSAPYHPPINNVPQENQSVHFSIQPPSPQQTTPIYGDPRVLTTSPSVLQPQYQMVTRSRAMNSPNFSGQQRTSSPKVQFSPVSPFSHPGAENFAAMYGANRRSTPGADLNSNLRGESPDYEKWAESINLRSSSHVVDRVERAPNQSPSVQPTFTSDYEGSRSPRGFPHSSVVLSPAPTLPPTPPVDHSPRGEAMPLDLRSPAPSSRTHTPYSNYSTPAASPVPNPFFGIQNSVKSPLIRDASDNRQFNGQYYEEYRNEIGSPFSVRSNYSTPVGSPIPGADFSNAARSDHPVAPQSSRSSPLGSEASIINRMHSMNLRSTSARETSSNSPFQRWTTENVAATIQTTIEPRAQNTSNVPQMQMQGAAPQPKAAFKMFTPFTRGQGGNILEPPRPSPLPTEKLTLHYNTPPAQAPVPVPPVRPVASYMPVTAPIRFPTFSSMSAALTPSPSTAPSLAITAPPRASISFRQPQLQLPQQRPQQGPLAPLYLPKPNIIPAFRGLGTKVSPDCFSVGLADRLEETYDKRRKLVMTRDGMLMTPLKFLETLTTRMKIGYHKEVFRFASENQVQWRTELFVGGFCGVGHALSPGYSVQLAAAHVLERIRAHFRELKTANYALYPGSQYTKVGEKLLDLSKKFDLGTPTMGFQFQGTKGNPRTFSEEKQWKCTCHVKSFTACAYSDNKQMGGNIAARGMYLNFVQPSKEGMHQLRDYYGVGADCPMLRDIHCSVMLNQASPNKQQWLVEYEVPTTQLDPVLHDPTNSSRYLFNTNQNYFSKRVGARRKSTAETEDKMMTFKRDLLEALDWMTVMFRETSLGGARLRRNRGGNSGVQIEGSQARGGRELEMELFGEQVVGVGHEEMVVEDIEMDV